MKSIISDIKIFIVDCDGCLTDGFMYYTDEGQYMKKFNAKDGMGLMQVKRNGIKTGIVTGDTHLIAQKRAEHLNLDFVESGIKAKHKSIEKILQKFGFEWKDLAFFGDDVNDLEVIKRCGLAFCPNDAHQTVKKYVNLLNGIVCENDGGYACVRQACDILTNNCTFGEL